MSLTKNLQLLTVDEVKAALLLSPEPPKDRDRPSKEILKQIDICAFWGAPIWGIIDNGKLVSLNMTKFGKRKKNIWEPYANWYLAYTAPEYRRQGFAGSIGLVMKQKAREAGCVRIRSLAGSWAGASLHNSLGDLFWGLTPKNEVIVDSPLGSKVFPDGVCPSGSRNAGEADNYPTEFEHLRMICGEKLRYD